MTAFRRVEDSRAGSAALGILVPPGSRTVVILRPRALDWDLLPLRLGEKTWPPAFCDFGRDEAAGVARRVQHALEQSAGVGPNPVEAVASPSGTGYLVCCRQSDFAWIACPRLPGKPYQPLVFPTQEEAVRAAAEIAAFLWPAADAQQEFYFNTQNFALVASSWREGPHCMAAYTPILATLGYLLSPDGKQVLLIHRNRRTDDPHLGKYNGLGGKLDRGEDVVACLRREIREEAGLECDLLVLRGTISWPGFGKHGEDWFGFIFRIDRWHGTPHTENPEGTLEWVDVDGILQLPLWEGDRYFVPLVFEHTERQFHGVMPYRDGRPLGWSYSLI